MNKKGTSLILSRTSLIISLAHMALLSYFFIFSLNNTDTHSGLGMLLAFMLPHLFAFLLAVIFSGLVTWIPRMIPFILVKYKGLPAIVERFLKFLPVSIIFALILSSVVTGKVGNLPQIKWLDFLAIFPTAWVAFRYRNLVGTVLFGVVLIAVLRLVF